MGKSGVYVPRTVSVNTVAVNDEEPDIEITATNVNAVPVPPLVEATAVPSLSNLVPIPPPFLIPTSDINLSKVIIPGDSKRWELTAKLSKRCGVLLSNTSSETKQLRELKIPIEASEIVVYVYAKKDEGGGAIAKAIEDNSLLNLAIARQHRAALLTRGSLQFLARNKKSFKSLFCMNDKYVSDISLSIFDVRGIHISPINNVAIIAFKSGREDQQNEVQEHNTMHNEMIRYALYQTPEMNGIISPLSSALVAAYTSMPRWAVPVAWSGNVPPLPAVPQHKYSQWMGIDGGFSSAMYAAALAAHIKLNIEIGNLNLGQDAISSAVMAQQPSRSFGFNTIPGVRVPHTIDLLKLANDVSIVKKGHVFYSFVLAGLNALTFNLVFRKLKLTNITDYFNLSGGAGRYYNKAMTMPIFRNTLAKTFLYNVTLREVDCEGLNLSGFGESLGSAWAANAQPLISKINFSSCNLDGDDLNGLLRGLARIWCGGTALAESIVMPNNPGVPVEVWDYFFQAFIDPSKVSNWPQSPPPSPNLSFLQVLDLRGTKAIGLGLVSFAKKLTGLRTLKLSASTRTHLTIDVLSSLSSANAPLEVFEGNTIDDSCTEALFHHSQTLKQVTLNEFIGDAAQLLCNWPQPVPKLKLCIGSNHTPTNNLFINPRCPRYSPGNLALTNDHNFATKAIDILSQNATGLKHLVIHNMDCYALSGAAPTFLTCGLESIHVFPPEGKGEITPTGKFWDTLSASKTLRDFQFPNQLMQSGEVDMVGRFLKSNRSVNSIGFDSDSLVLNVEVVKVLRSAFYGNKKVVNMDYLSKARQNTIQEFRNEINGLLNCVQQYKAEIKTIFQRAYSKWNPNWRRGPNRDKLPWVEKIRVAKRRIGQLNRDQAKIAQLLDEIRICILENKRNNAIQDEQKSKDKLARCEGQLGNLAVKKKRFMTKLVTKLNRAKRNGRKHKSAKMQVPRSTYYKSKHMWPSRTLSSRQLGHMENSRFRYYNDPYHARYHYYPHYYPHNYYHHNPNYYGGNYNGDEEHEDNTGLDDAPTEEELEETNAGNGNESELNNDPWDDMLAEVDDTFCEPDDPWANIDALIQQTETEYNAATSPEFLAMVHEECSELGIDVVEGISETLDAGAAVEDKLNEIGTSVSLPTEDLHIIADSSLEDTFDLSTLESTLPDLPENNDDYDFDDVMDADDAVGMYAGAGPRDLDDGGPSYGSYHDAVLAGAQRRARARKNGRIMRRVRDKSNHRLQVGYRYLSIIDQTTNFERVTAKNYVWPDDITDHWAEDVQMELVKAMSESKLFDLPVVSGKKHYVLFEWSCNRATQCSLKADMDVVLVTQCSLDRLTNLKAQLTHWTGKASVTVYVKPTESTRDAIDAITYSINCVKKHINETSPMQRSIEIVVTVVVGCIDDEPYPINYLRNVALLEARRQHMRFNSSLDNSAVLLVDVDFRPSPNLFTMVHSRHAMSSILRDRRVIVCPAFEAEDESAAFPRSIKCLKELVDKGEAEGFHRSHFPQGHGPTDFEKFWEISLQENHGYDNDIEYFWRECYKVEYKKFFEPYIIMASVDVPLYDERFQGYGLNKVSHLAAISSTKDGKFYVLPGVYMVAPAHERSESWSRRYGNSQPDEKMFYQLELKGLYHNFMKRLERGEEPIISDSTRSKQEMLVQLELNLKEKINGSNESSAAERKISQKPISCH